MPDLPDDEVFEEEENQVVELMDPEVAKSVASDFTPESYDQYLTANVAIARCESLYRLQLLAARATRMADKLESVQNCYLILICVRMSSSLMVDGSAATLIAETLLSQGDDEGQSYFIF